MYIHEGQRIRGHAAPTVSSAARGGAPRDQSGRARLRRRKTRSLAPRGGRPTRAHPSGRPRRSGAPARQHNAPARSSEAFARRHLLGGGGGGERSRRRRPLQRAVGRGRPSSRGRAQLSKKSGSAAAIRPFCCRRLSSFPASRSGAPSFATIQTYLLTGSTCGVRSRAAQTQKGGRRRKRAVRLTPWD